MNDERAQVQSGQEFAGSDLTHRQILTIMGGLLMGMFLASLDQTIVSTAIRTIADDLQGYDMQAWVTTAYLVTATITTPLYGKISDIYGRKPLLLTAITIFVIGSLLCSLATSMYELAAFRAIQGLGAGGLMTLALTTIGDIVAPRRRAKYQGYFLAVFGTSSVLGPVLGGFFAGQSEILWASGWRWVFLVNVPIGLVALVVVYRVLNYDQQKAYGTRTDYWGAAALATTVAPLLIVAEQGRTWGWDSPRALICFAIGIVGLGVFIWIETRMGDDALIPLRVFRNRVFAQGVGIAVIVGAVMFGSISMLPQYFQVLRGSSPMVAGLQMLPMVLGMMCGSILAGQLISRTGRYKIFTVFGSVMIAVATFLLHLVGTQTPLWAVMAMAAMLGLGLGNLLQPTTLAMQNILPPQDMGLSTGTATFFRQIGATLGVAVFFSLLFSLMGPNIGDNMSAAAQTPEFRAAVVEAAGSTDPQVRDFGRALISAGAQADGQQAGGQQAGGQQVGSGDLSETSSSVMSDTSVLEKLPDDIADPIKEGFADSMDKVFLSVSILSLLAILGTATWRELPLRQAKPARESVDPAEQE